MSKYKKLATIGCIVFGAISSFLGHDPSVLYAALMICIAMPEGRNDDR